MKILRPVPESFSIYMDGLRLFAAFYVLLFHMRKLEIGSLSFLRLIPDHGHDAVILFFVLSGYVISATVDRKFALGWRDYFLDRAARVYSVALPTLVLCALVAFVLADHAGALGGVSVGALLVNSLINTFFLGQSWGLKEWVLYNQPYWSLCYEVLYYAMFGVAMFARGAWRWFGLVVVALLAGPKVLLLLPCWLVGVVAYRWRDRWRLKPASAALLGFVFPVLVLWLLNHLGFGPAVRAGMDGWLPNRQDELEFSADFVIDYVTAALVAVNLYAVRYVPIVFPQWLSAIFRRGAGASFTLYLMHMPLIYLIVNLRGDARHTAAWFLVGAVGVPLVCYAVSHFTEKKRSALRGWLDAHTPNFN